jgi:hypothetical protein
VRVRITVKGENAELRGYIDEENLMEFAAAMKPIGVVIASPQSEDYDPFKEW